MNCPFCKEKLKDGERVCSNCSSWVIDFDYLENMEKIEQKYSKTSLLDLSKEKLTYEEIITIYTFIERADHHGGDGEVSHGTGRNGTSSNLSKRLKEIKNGLQ